MAATTELARRVQTLPQELRESVLHYTLTTPDTVTIDRTYRPLPQLQVDGATRQTTSRSLYGPSTAFVISNICLCNQWLQSLSVAARQSIQNIDYIRVVGDNSDQIVDGVATSGYRKLFSNVGKWYKLLSRQVTWNARRESIFVQATRHGQGWDLDGGILGDEREGDEVREGESENCRSVISCQNSDPRH
ncbi:hypothetical protein DOTSEDRAFT_25508 [Dothistroma septosporum NZE10]|uniref:F-box domain-containing protein n=1 Tax=Dothistroma septosporum (strain NZE10 / CBS 128990) TaxID=675120 RepID=M2YNJ5_DOTSN|nr:hypothetical protein DOTSEDRAFT_25508 [Dothistroma septosporum NZE10]